MTPTRRRFLTTASAAALAAVTRRADAQSSATEDKPKLERPAAAGSRGIVVIASANGLGTVQKAAEMIAAGADTLDAVVAGVNLVEEDPNDTTVGYGGLPNEEGVVELDASVMHGPTCRAGSVASLRNIMHPSRVAKVVMERTDHVMLVGDGALRFAKAHGFKEVDLLTDKAREEWLTWRETHSTEDDWLAPETPGTDERRGNRSRAVERTYGTINCCAVNERGDLSGVTTTSGLAFKIPGRVGDSPIIGAGLYVDNQVGAAGSTGRGEANIKACGAHTIVEALRRGLSPVDACLHALRRVVETTTEKRLLDKTGRPAFDVKYYAIAKNGAFGSASIWSGGKFAVWSDGRARLEECAFLYQRES